MIYATYTDVAENAANLIRELRQMRPKTDEETTRAAAALARIATELIPVVGDLKMITRTNASARKDAGQDGALRAASGAQRSYTLTEDLCSELIRTAHQLRTLNPKEEMVLLPLSNLHRLIDHITNLAETQKITADPRLLESLEQMRQGNTVGLDDLRTYLEEAGA